MEATSLPVAPCAAPGTAFFGDVGVLLFQGLAVCHRKPATAAASPIHEGPPFRRQDFRPDSPQRAGRGFRVGVKIRFSSKRQYMRPPGKSPRQGMTSAIKLRTRKEISQGLQPLYPASPARRPVGFALFWRLQPDTRLLSMARARMLRYYYAGLARAWRGVMHPGVIGWILIGLIAGWLSG